MPLDVTKPIDQEVVSKLPYWIRALHAAVNAITEVGEKAATTLTVPAATVALVVSASGDLDPADIETVIISGSGPSSITQIIGGLDGMLKIFVFQDSNISFVDSDSKSNGTFYLNQLPSGGSFDPNQSDVITLLNIGGDGVIEGYWKELYRTLSVK